MRFGLRISTHEGVVLAVGCILYVWACESFFSGLRALLI
jgi:hypothetical protein